MKDYINIKINRKTLSRIGDIIIWGFCIFLGLIFMCMLFLLVTSINDEKMYQNGFDGGKDFIINMIVNDSNFYCGKSYTFMDKDNRTKTLHSDKCNESNLEIASGIKWFGELK